MTGDYWVLGIVCFLFVLSIKKYVCIDSLRESILEYLAVISPSRIASKGEEIVEEDDLVELEEIRDMIEDYVIRNPQLFSKVSVKHE
tara:strand:- start:253 stop:513 length:261 start_codon:yes stop_codon:yes gene_type:complete